VAAALGWLNKFGWARLSGSGGCIFIETKSQERAEFVAGQCPPSCSAHVAFGVERSPLLEALARHRGAA
jgi:4-diphosphocytidyl-2-C-methyl-D-erythritol kinase